MSKVSLGLVLAGTVLVLTGATIGCGEEERAPLLIKEAQGGSYSYGGASPDPDDGVNHFPGATGSGQCSGSESMAYMEGSDWEWEANADDAYFDVGWYEGKTGVHVYVYPDTGAYRDFRFWDGDAMQEKTYSDAVRWGSSVEGPEMSATGCTAFSDASFSVSEIEWDDNGQLERFRATFDRHCDDYDGEDQKGCVLYVRGAQ
jgi:hypothetical protein